MSTAREIVAILNDAYERNPCTCGHDGAEHGLKNQCLVEGCSCQIFCTPQPKPTPGSIALAGLRAQGFVVLPVADVEFALRYMQTVADGMERHGKDMSDWKPLIARIEEALNHGN